MKAFIYVGGKIDPDFITEHPKGDDLTVAADSGIRNAQLLGDHIDIAVGDFDSFPERDIPEDAEIVRLRPEKDLTDSQVAVEIALERGAESFVIIGGLSGRLDHTLANLSILEDLTARTHYAIMTDGVSRVHFINGGSALIGRSGFKYFSLIAATDIAKGVSIEGAKYPLKNARLSRRNGGFATSNEIDGNCALISVKKGALFIIESRDA
ncbi:MAG: thiamine diphosphokinase [Clostridia bacterium]|nr:thiamine diphosphokinase [Clostridia bacterium]